MSTIADFSRSSAIENVKAALVKARDNGQFNSIINLTEEHALHRAEMVDRGEISGRLAGVPFIAKDNFLTFGAPTTAASTFLKNFQAPLQAAAIEKLEAEGAICIGKANLDAFAHGGSTENSAFGVTHNAYDMSKVAGGSSGGSAVVVALDIVPFALGTDTGGSIRQPASFNGVVGMKPTYGMVSRYGVVAMASSTDTIGVLASTASDAETVMDIINGQDTKDMTTLPDFFEPTTINKSLKIGIISEAVSDGLDQPVQAAVQQCIAQLEACGHTVETVHLPMLRYALAVYYIVVPAEISSNLARYDGIRYGERAQADSLSDTYGASRDNGFMPENKRRILIGSYVLSSGFFDAYYLKAQKARTMLIDEFDDLFSKYDLLLTPVAPTPAFSIGEKSIDPVQMYLADVMTVPASLAGLPAISVPITTSDNGLPIGMQFIAKRQDDALLLALARSLEETR